MECTRSRISLERVHGSSSQSLILRLLLFLVVAASTGSLRLYGVPSPASPASASMESQQGPGQRKSLAGVAREERERRERESGPATTFTNEGSVDRARPNRSVNRSADSPENHAPVVNAGADQTITFPLTASLAGSVADDGLPADLGSPTSTWSQVSGPGLASFADAASPTTLASFATAGTYVLQLSANDTELSASDYVRVVVKEAAETNSGNRPNAQISSTLSELVARLGAINTSVLPLSGPPFAAVASPKSPAVEIKATVVAPEPKVADDVGPLAEDAGPLAEEVVPDIEVETPEVEAIDPVIEPKAPVARDVGPATEEVVPTAAEVVPTAEEVAPVVEEETPEVGDIDPVVESEVPAVQDVEPLAADVAPLAADAGPLAEEVTPVVEVEMPEVEEIDPVTEPEAPVAEDVVPTAAELVPDVEVETPEVKEIDPVVEPEAPEVEEIVPVVELGPVNRRPVVNAGLDQWVVLPDTASLSATVSDDGLPESGTLTTTWTRIQGPSTVSFADASSAVTSVSFSAPGIYVLRLWVSDGDLDTSDDVMVRVEPEPEPENQGPIVNAGPNQWVKLSDTPTLSGSVSDDGLPDGTLTISWAQVEGPGTVSFADASSAVTSVGFHEPGIYVLRLQGSDGALDSSDDIVITVEAAPEDEVSPEASEPAPENERPTVNAGADQWVVLPDVATLSGSVGDDGLPDGSLTASWAQVEGPGTASFADASSAVTSVGFSEPGIYILRLWVSDGVLDSTDDLMVTVEAVLEPEPPEDDDIFSGGFEPENVAPVVDAGADRWVELPQMATLTGSVSDDDLPHGNLTISWAQVEGAGTVSFADGSNPTTSASFSEPGTYQLRLWASDGDLDASDDVMVTVAAEPAPEPQPENQRPSVNAGSDQWVELPDTVTLSGSVSDDDLPDGSLTISWAQVEGAGTVSFADGSNPTTSASFSEPGTYQLRLWASDGDLDASDDVMVTVAPEPAPEPQPEPEPVPEPEPIPEPVPDPVPPVSDTGTPVIVRPAAIDDVLYNPGLGAELWYRSEGQQQPQSYPEVKVTYYRWYWHELEPVEGQIDFSRFDNALDDATASGDRAAFRLMTAGANNRITYNGQTGAAGVPQWFADKVGGTWYATQGDNIFWPDHNNPQFLAEIQRVMSALGGRYAGHPGLNHWDASFFGCWGEQNDACLDIPNLNPGRAKDNWWTPQTYEQAVDIQMAALPGTPFIQLAIEAGLVGGTIPDYAVLQRGTGWRVDCFGDFGNIVGYNFMDESYAPIVARYFDAWQTGMVSFEICSNLATWESAGVDFDRIMDKALEWHASSINLKAGDVPQQWMPKLLDTIKRMGYRLRIEEMEHPTEIQQGASMSLRLVWQNDGVAPPYHTYIPAVNLVPAAGGPGHTFEISEDVKTWLPGVHATTTGVPLGGLAAGDYTVRVGLLSPHDRKPVIQLANEGADAEGWYALSTVTIVAGP